MRTVKEIIDRMYEILDEIDASDASTDHVRIRTEAHALIDELEEKFKLSYTQTQQAQRQ